MKNIMIIEDDVSLSNGINLALKNNEFFIVQVHNLKVARYKLLKNKFDLIILDVNLPDGNGIDFLIEVRKTSTVAVIVLTANDMETDIVTGLESGADDYITKPFSLAVLRARVNTQLRKQTQNVNSKIVIDSFIFDFEKIEYSKNNVQIELSKTEQKLLKIFVQNKGITISRADLVDRIWIDGADYVDENALSVTVKRLRTKLEDNPAKPEYIKTIYGIGYVWKAK